MPHNTRTMPGLHWINAPTEGSLFKTLTGAHGDLCPPTGRRIHCSGAGDLHLIPIGKTAAAGVLFKTVVDGEIVDQECDGIGTGSTTTVSCVQF